MKGFFTILFTLLFTVGYGQNSVYFTSDPILSPDGSKIIFAFNGDLWMVQSDGGLAQNLTSLDGFESDPIISPDGHWLAFTSTQYGNQDVFIMPMEGGNIRQLTFNDGSDIAESWSWDSKLIYIASNRYNRLSTYTISTEGGTPKRIVPHYFNNIHNVVEDPAGKLFFNESWESSIFTHRKRYKGAYNPDIKSYDPSTGSYEKLTDYEGKDMWPTLDRNGNMFLASDEANGEYNLYSFSNSEKKQITSFDTSIKRPRVSANGQKVVFEKDYQIFTLNVSSGESFRVPIQLPLNLTLDQEKDFKVSGKISAYDVSMDGKKIAFVSRGEIFICDIEGKYVKQIRTNPREKVDVVYWLKDSKTLIFNQTTNGYLNWYTISAENPSNEQKLTNDNQNNRNFSFNSDRSQGVYLSGRNEVRIMDTSDYSSRTIVRDELWAIYNPNPYFSPSDDYIIFTAYRDFEPDIFAYNISAGTIINLTNTAVPETDPFWGPDGKYLYFEASRTEPGYPRGGGDIKLYRIALDKYDSPFKSDKVVELFEEEEKDEEEDEKDKKGKSKKGEDNEEKDAEKLPLVINMDGIWERWERIGPNFGNQGSPYVVKEKDKTIILYYSNHDKGEYSIWKTTLEDFEDPKTEKVELTGNTSSIRKSDDKYYILSEGDIHTLDISEGKGKKIEISYTFRRNLQQEFTQMFYEAWANFEENYYDDKFHGMDWNALKAQYEKYLPFITNRNDLRVLFNDMLGELNTSHFGFYSNGKEEETYYGSRSLNPGILFEDDNPFVVRSIIKRSPADKKGIDIRFGDKLVAVDDRKINETVNREYYFSRPSMDEELELTFSRSGSEFKIKLHPQSTGSNRANLYDSWIDDNQKRVDEKTQDQVAYIHMKNMGGGALNDFLQEMVHEANNKKALILDIRYNTGGNVHDDVLRFLSRREYLQWKYREGKLTGQSNFSPAEKPIVLLINEQTLSDGEMTAAGFKKLGLGTVVGTETYRWIIFTTGKGLVDGSFYRLPSWGCYTLDGADLELTGVKPDIEIHNTFKDRLEGNDPQLDRAIEIIMSEMQK
jgi:tricorn protease